MKQNECTVASCKRATWVLHAGSLHFQTSLLPGLTRILTSWMRISLEIFPDVTFSILQQWKAGCRAVKNVLHTLPCLTDHRIQMPFWHLLKTCNKVHIYYFVCADGFIFFINTEACKSTEAGNVICSLCTTVNLSLHLPRWCAVVY